MGKNLARTLIKDLFCIYMITYIVAYLVSEHVCKALNVQYIAQIYIAYILLQYIAQFVSYKNMYEKLMQQRYQRLTQQAQNSLAPIHPYCLTLQHLCFSLLSVHFSSVQLSSIQLFWNWLFW